MCGHVGGYVFFDPGTHMIPMEQPDALAAALMEFRKGIESASSPNEAPRPG
jgi:hypothetical protein